jgi:hypothetical protein
MRHSLAQSRDLHLIVTAAVDGILRQPVITIKVQPFSPAFSSFFRALLAVMRYKPAIFEFVSPE